jgi:hypothetical protein
MSSWIDLKAVGEIVGVGLLAGAGLPALFAVGMRAMSLPGKRGTTAAADSDRVVGGSRAGIAIGLLCFGLILAAVGYGIDVIVVAWHAK